MNNDFFMHFILESIPRIYLNKSWLINTWYPPLKTIAKSLVYWVTFNAAPFSALSWLTDDSLPWFNYWKTAVWRNYGEGPLCRIDTTISSAAKQQSFWFNITIESVVLPTEKRALSTQSKISVKETQNMLGYCHHIVHGAHQVMVWKYFLI